MAKYETSADREEKQRLESLTGFEAHIFADYLDALERASGLAPGEIIGTLHYISAEGYCYNLKILEGNSMSFNKDDHYVGLTPIEVAQFFSYEDTAAINSPDHMAGRRFHSGRIEKRAAQLSDSHTLYRQHLTRLVG